MVGSPVLIKTNGHGQTKERIWMFSHKKGFLHISENSKKKPANGLT